MTLRPDTRARTRTRTGIRTKRRLSPCYRHPDEPITGICPSCLRERLSGLDTSSTANFTSAVPGLRRSRSVVSISQCEALSSSVNELRRKSCDVVSARSSLSNLFDVDDVKIGSDIDTMVESKNLGLSRVTYTVVKSENHNQENRVSVDKLGVLNADRVDSDEEEEGEFRTMKEYIDLECHNKAKKSKDLRQIAGNFLGAASVFSKKLRKWGLKNNRKKTENLKSSGGTSIAGGGDGKHKLFENSRRLEENNSEFLGRRSCDTEPRFSVDAGQISFEEPRASWDGYMIARTIPRLAPMLSIVENGMLKNRFEKHRLSVDDPMHSIIEDESSSGVSGNSNSDSSSSMKGSSFDRSSSVRSFGKKLPSSEDHGLSPVNPKLVITEKELKDWHLSSSGGEASESFGSLSRDNASITAENNSKNMPPKKSVRWHKVCNVFGLTPKKSESKSEVLKENVIDPLIDEIGQKQGKEFGGNLKDINGWKLTRSNSVVGSINPCDTIVGSNYRRRSVDSAGGWAFKGMGEFMPEINRNEKYCSTNLEAEIAPFYTIPLRSLRRSKSGKFKLQNSHSIVGNVLQLN